MIGQSLSHFRITAKLGEGGMGEVWRAEDTRLDRQVAIKVLPEAVAGDPDRLARFEREAKVLASLNHPFIAGIYEVGSAPSQEGEAASCHFLAMELAEGEDLAERLERGALPPDEALIIASQLAEALEAAHEKGVIHRDLKPQNIKLTPDSASGVAVKVLDFGLAKALGPEESGPGSSPQLTHSPTMTLGATVEGVILGTAAYMSPEQAKGQVADKRADIWSFGVVLWEMLTGRRLFDADTAPETLARVLTAEPDLATLPDSTPPALVRLLRRCLERNPHNRLRDIGDARLLLAEIRSGAADEPTAIPVETSPDRPSRRLRELVAWAIAAVAVLAAGALLLSRSDDRSAAPRVIRSTLSLPEGLTIELDGTRAGMPVLSPDGTRIAFGARLAREPLRIWVQDLETSETRPLPGTEQGYRPFWSPDGQKIGFFTWFHLSTTPSDGGPVTTLAPARDARGGSWGDDGTIIYTPFSVGPIHRIPADGGTPELATAVPEGRATNRFPWFLPDSQHFLYLARNNAPGGLGTGAITLGRLGSTEPLARISEERSNAIYASGYLLYAQGSSLVAERFDPSTLTKGGESKVLVDDLLVNRRFTYGVFSASETGVLAFLTGRQRDLSRLAWRDRSGGELGALEDAVNMSGYGGLALSTDGRWAAVSIVDEATTQAGLWLFDLRRGSKMQFGDSTTDRYSPVFTPDSRALFYGADNSHIVRRDLATGDETVILSEDTDFDFLPMFVAPDGERLVVERRLGVGEEIAIAQVAVDGSGTIEILLDESGYTMSPQLSPSGRWLAWSSDASGRSEIYLGRYPRAEGRLQVSRSGGVEPHWSVDGTEIFYKTLENRVMAVSVEPLSDTLALGEPEPLFDVTEFDGFTYLPSIDGERFLVRDPLAERDASPITLLTDWPALLE